MTSNKYRKGNTATTMTLTSKICIETRKADGDSCEYMKCSVCPYFFSNFVVHNLFQSSKYRLHYRYRSKI